MKKFLTIAAMAALVSGSAFAQVNTTEETSITINSSAHVYVPLHAAFYNNQSSLDFGAMNRGTLVDIWASQGNGTQAALFTIEGDADDEIAITIPTTFNLDWAGGYGGNANNRIVASTLTASSDSKTRVTNLPGGFPNGGTPQYTSGTPINLSHDADGTATGGASAVDNLGQLFVSVGARAQASATQQRGPYSGTLTINMDYTMY
jgi:hypothetical protein